MVITIVRYHAIRCIFHLVLWHIMTLCISCNCTFWPAPTSTGLASHARHKKPLKRLPDVHVGFQPDTCGLKNLHPAKGIGGEQKGRWSRSWSAVKAEPPSEPCHGQTGNHRNNRQHGVEQKGGGGGDPAADLLEQPLDDRPSLPDHLGRAPLHRHLRRRHGFREQDQVCWIHQRLQWR